ncbi:MAG: hypothetical protein RDU20_12315 [Desulfomonilaceae bacterium]|nr:hypothetical protein [Desulfomonilaceae bacterium]
MRKLDVSGAWLPDVDQTESLENLESIDEKEPAETYNTEETAHDAVEDSCRSPTANLQL